MSPYIFSSFSLIFLMLIFIPSFPARTISKSLSNSIVVEKFRINDHNSFKDTETVSSGCGVTVDRYLHNVHSIKHFEYFPDQPRWVRPTPIVLTYSISTNNSISYLSQLDIKAVFQRAFAQWASVIPISFIEVENYDEAEIKIGFYSGDHGDGQPFDGVLGVLAHAFSPESGVLHLDAMETWAVDFGSEKSKTAVDLESVALHEIGHVLGLAHSEFKESVMYPNLNPRTKKVELKLDDIKGVQALYGSNPNFSLSPSLLESDLTSNRAHNIEIKYWTKIMLLFILCIFVQL